MQHDQDAGDEAEGEPVEEDRDVLAGRGRARTGTAGTTTATHARAEQPAEGLGEVAAEGVLLPRGLQRREQHHDEQEVAGRVGEVVERGR